MTVLDEVIVEVHGRLVHRRRWLDGAHPELGIIVRGLTGIETVQDTYRISASVTFDVESQPVAEHVHNGLAEPVPRIVRLHPLAV